MTALSVLDTFGTSELKLATLSTFDHVDNEFRWIGVVSIATLPRRGCSKRSGSGFAQTKTEAEIDKVL